jgi:hypothetical protein
MTDSDKDIELSITAAIVDGRVTVYGFLENYLDEPIRIEGASSCLYDIIVLDEEENRYGERAMHLQAPHAVDIESGHSWVVQRSFDTFEEVEERNEEIDLEVDVGGFDPLADEEGYMAPIDPSYGRELAAEVEFYNITNLETGEKYDVGDTTSFTPSNLPVGKPERPDLPVDTDASMSMSSGRTVWNTD